MNLPEATWTTDEFVAVTVRLADPEAEPAEILHLAAARRAGGKTLARFSSLLQTHAAPSYRLRTLLGLEGEAIARAPAAEAVAADLRSFVGTCAVVVDGGARAAAALSCLIEPSGLPVCDLHELFGLFHPDLDASDARTQAGLLGVAVDDPSEEGLAAAVYEHLYEEARALDPLILHEIVLRTAQTTWPLRSFFAAAASVAVTLPVAKNQPEGTALPALASSPARSPLASGSPRRSLDTTGIAETLAAATADGTGEYEPRAEQLRMAEAVTAALGDPHHLLVEAGTGTGKSLAYLVPAACLALRTGSRVLISTNTINLQEQLLRKDLPAVQRLLASYAPEDIRTRAGELQTAALKGRRNYLCLQRLATLRRTPVLADVEVRFLVRMLLWLGKGGGDRSGLRLPEDEEALWNRMSAEGANCFATGNYFVRNGSCQLARARKRAEAAHLVIANHALLLSDVCADRNLLLAYERLIVDEAHNLEQEATDRFGFHAGQGEIGALLDAILTRGREREAGLVVDVQTAVHGRQAGAADAFLSGLIAQLVERVDRARERSPETFAVLKSFVQQQGRSEGEYEQRMLVNRATRAQPEWSQVELAWENLDVALSSVEDGLERLAIALGERDDGTILDREALVAALAAQQLAIRMVREGVGSILGRHDETRIAWLTLSTGGVVGVSSAPLNVGELLDAYLFSAKASVVLTSATLTTEGSFAYVRERLGLDEAQELALGSPFDYRRAALLLLPADLPDLTHPQYQRALEDAIVNLCRGSRGRALVLFTSHAALRATHRAVRPRLSELGLRALAQGLDGTPDSLLQTLRARPETAILGTSSFWEGVDVVGEALSLLVIAKLPFSVPSDPVFAARAELLDEPFRDYALPQAILRFKQGFGRLIRHRADRGVVAVLDRRLRSKGYGRSFLRSLPDCTLHEPAIAELSAEVERWLGTAADAGLQPGAPAARRPRRRAGAEG